jgi:hypothetical protein
MDERADWVGPVRALLYPVQFEPAPIDGVERVLRMVVRAGALGATPAQYLAAIRAALASRRELAGLIPQPHPEAAVRAYLAELERRLAPAEQAE